jgi:hypothetical protein
MAALFMRKKTPKSAGNQSSGEIKQVAIKHIFPEGMRTAFSNHVTVQRTSEGEFTISFFDIIQPVMIGAAADVEELAKNLDSVTANCIGRFAVSEKRMPRLIAALAEIYEQFVQSQNAKESEPQSNGKKKHAS